MTVPALLDNIAFQLALYRSRNLRFLIGTGAVRSGAAKKITAQLDLFPLWLVAVLFPAHTFFFLF